MHPKALPPLGRVAGRREGRFVRTEDIVERLMVLGLEPLEAAVYVHLQVAGPSKAGDIAAALHYQRTETYRTLDALVLRGFVRATDERPSRFEAAPIEQVFGDILAREEARAAEARRAEADIAPALRSLRAPGAAAPETLSNTFKLLQGRREATDALARLVRGAKGEALWVDTHPGAAAMAQASGAWDLLRRRAGEGVRVRAMLRAGPEAEVLARTAAPVEVRQVSSGAMMRLIVADQREMLLWLTSDPGPTLAAERDQALWTDAAHLVATQHALVEALWRDPSREGAALPPAGSPAPRRP